MSRKIIAIAILLFVSAGMIYAAPPASIPMPDEGMWLPLYLKKLNEKAMKSDGARFTADDVYNINHSSFKDAVVRLNGGMCTAEIVSPEGLLLTNHHCGYEKIAEHSDVTHDYLKDGFWAMKKSDELENPKFKAEILVYMEDETDLLNNAVKSISADDAKGVRLQAMMDSIGKVASKDGKYNAEVESFFEGNQYFLLVYQEFKDIRLVGAPPSSIGKFGGDVDNWMWPRHTGDFSVFRIYTAPDGSPAEYSKDNVPYKPKYYFPISLSGEKKGDFAMVMGYPGHTDRYATSSDLAFSRDYSNPAIVDAFETQLNVMKKDMDADEAIKIKLAETYASESNTYKYYVGQELLLKHGAGFSTKLDEEKGFTDWVNGDDARKKKFGAVLSDIKDGNDKLKSIEPAFSYFNYGFASSQLFRYYTRYSTFFKYTRDDAPKPGKGDLDTAAKKINKRVNEYFSSSTGETDKKTFKAVLFDMYNKIPAESRPDVLTKMVSDNKKAATPEIAINEFVDKLYKKSMLLDKDRANSFLNHPNLKKLKNDPYFSFMREMVKYYLSSLYPVYGGVSNQISNAHKLYVEGLMEWKKNKDFYPDANSTLRVTYGNVLPYIPRDGVSYKYYTTYEGILEKSNPKDPEFIVPQRELDLFAKKDFGRYGQDDTLRINFLANTDITGGNSGSPVLDADGNLIGLAFDGDWESMIGDLVFNPATNRTICVDIRYVLWVMDKYAGATNLINEMKIVGK